jgi:GNAT superfamily N-acetyltransferase
VIEGVRPGMGKGMRILRLDPGDDYAIRGCFEVREAVRAADDPFRPPESLRVFRTDLFTVWDGSPTEVWYAPDAEGSVAGWYPMVLPDRQNVHWGLLDVLVRPARRRAGLGTALLRHAAMNDAPHRDGVEPHAWDAGQTPPPTTT